MTARPGILDDDAIAIGPEPAEAAAVAILVHGRGRSPVEMRDLAVGLANPSISFVMPAAPDGAWYPESFLAPIEENEPALTTSLTRYGRIVDAALAEGMAPENIILCGFSQGACLTAEFLIRNPRPHGAVLIFTGGFIGPPGMQWPVQPALKGVPVYLTGSVVDEWVPPARVEETGQLLSASGARVKQTIFEDRAHEVCEEEMAAAGELLAWWARRYAGGGRQSRRANN
jgi:phospholipase/carboxylesterase